MATLFKQGNREREADTSIAKQNLVFFRINLVGNAIISQKNRLIQLGSSYNSSCTALSLKYVLRPRAALRLLPGAIVNRTKYC